MPKKKNRTFQISKKVIIMIKKLWAVCLCASLILGLAGCNTIQENKQTDSGKLQIITTLFPQYDFARQIAGDLAEVTLLLPPGTEAHTYEPSPADIIKYKKPTYLFTPERYGTLGRRNHRRS